MYIYIYIYFFSSGLRVLVCIYRGFDKGTLRGLIQGVTVQLRLRCRFGLVPGIARAYGSSPKPETLNPRALSPRP